MVVAVVNRFVFFLNELGVKFEDNRLNRDQFVALQKAESHQLTFGSVPLLEEGKFSIVQGTAIMAYIAKQNGAYPSNIKDGAYADGVVMGVEDFRMKMFDQPFTKAKASLDGRSEVEVTEINAAVVKVKDFVANVWNGRWATNFEHIIKSSGTGFVVGKTLTHADVSLFDVLDALQGNLGHLFSAGIDEKAYPNLAKFYGEMKNRTNIKKYLETRK
jgi:glutathione S-transferase